MKARRPSGCQKCGSSIKPGIEIDRASFQVQTASYRKTSWRPVTAYVHELCAREARAEWPELQT